MTRKSTIFILTILVWLLTSAVWGVLYVHSKLALTGLEGYERDWDFQLIMFFAFRFPWLFTLLIGALWAERKWLE